jgi:hypothetical protein
MTATLYQFTDTGAPELTGNGDGLFTLLAWALGAAGWTVVADDTTLEATPARGTTATLSLVREGNRFHPFVSNLIQDVYILAGEGEIREKIMANLAAGEAWDANLTDAEILAVLVALGVPQRMPKLPDTVFARLPASVQAKIVANVTAGKDWHDNLTGADYQAAYNAMNLSITQLLSYYNRLPSAITSQLIANYMANRDMLYGLSNEQILLIIQVVGISFSAEDFDITPVGGEALLAQLSPELAQAITANVMAKAPWHTDLARADLLAVADAAGVDTELQTLNGISLFPGIEEVVIEAEYQDENAPLAWAVMADDRAFVLLVGETPPPGEDDFTPDLAVCRYHVALLYGTLLHPSATHNVVVVQDESYLDSIFSDATGGGEVGYRVQSLDYFMAFSDWHSGGIGWGAPLAVNTPWVFPLQLMMSDRSGELMSDTSTVIGILPFLEMVMSYVDPQGCASGQQIAQNRWLFHTRFGGSYILRASDVPMTSLA